MKVQLINKEERKNFLSDWGQIASICYDTPEGREKGVGKHCLKNGHFSGSRYLQFMFKIEGISRACSHQLVRHNIGVDSINQRSQRYCNEEGFEYVTPPSINKDERLDRMYCEIMESLEDSYNLIVSELMDTGRTQEEAREDARFILPNACTTELHMSFSLEALINLANKRLCVRSQWEIRQLTQLIVKEVVECVPELKSYLVPQCFEGGYCKENKKDCIRPIKE